MLNFDYVDKHIHRVELFPSFIQSMYIHNTTRRVNISLKAKASTKDKRLQEDRSKNSNQILKNYKALKQHYKNPKQTKMELDPTKTYKVQGNKLFKILKIYKI